MIKGEYSIVFNVKNIYLFPYFGVSLDLYHYLLLSCNEKNFYPETISDTYLTDTHLCFPFIKPNIFLLPQGSLASIPSNTLIVLLNDVTLLFALTTACQYYWQCNYDAPGQTGFSSPESFRVLLSDIMFTLSVYITHIASSSLVYKVSKIVLTFFMMSEARWMADENIEFFSNRSIVIKLPVNHDHVSNAHVRFHMTQSYQDRVQAQSVLLL